ncbi:MAG: YqgE/AlgH family protein [Planctomycetes bacterium]|nr:YqgE/AlgH family protein [Planctomycetota bacterium]MBL7008754.1 YqgE/AlgH family protein [Planctomycetota bacterium]
MSAPGALHPGLVLLADPALVDPHFEEAAVLLCAHDDQQGSLGLILNRPLDLPVGQLLPQAGELATARHGLSWGGPVAIEKLHALHGGATGMAECFSVCPGVEFGGVLEELTRVHAAHLPVRFFLGYTGWDSGQLDGELASGTWRLHPGGAQAAFDPEPDTLWGRLVGSLEPSLRWLQHRPQDPGCN